MKTEYTKKAKSLKIGQSFIIDKKYYDSAISTNTRLNRNGFGEFSLKTIDNQVIVTRIL